MNKHTWRILSGLITFLLIFIPYKLARYVITYTDEVWNEILWQPLLSKDIPLVGTILTILICYIIGGWNATKWGAWFQSNVLIHLPVIGSLLSSSVNPKSQQVIGEGGFILAPFWDGYRPAKITAIRKKKRGYFVIVTYLTFPLTVQTLEDATQVYALEVIEEGGVKYGLIPSDVSIKIELSGGTAVPEDALLNAEKITLKEFLRSKKFINNHTDTEK